MKYRLPRPTSHTRRNRAFTLIEMVLVLAIIALLMGVSIKLLSNVRNEGRIIKVRADMDGITSALSLYESAAYRLPTTEQGLEALVTKPTTGRVPRVWRKQMERLATDPWDEVYRYRYPGKHRTESFDLFSAGPDRTPETEDDIGNWMEF
ncbi:type II secretion system major pseudopilin GspG [soil metagenome]